MKTIGERIKEGLNLRNMKQADLVEKTKINKGSLSSYISGKYAPKQNNIYLIAKALNVNEAWLMGYDVSMERVESINSDNITKEEYNILKNYRKLNDLGKNEAIKRVEELTYISKYIEENNVTKFPKKAKQIWEEPGKEHLMPIACHDDNLTDEEKIIVNERINDVLKNIDKY